MHRVAIVMIMLMQVMYEMEGSQRTKVIKENEEKFIGNVNSFADNVSFEVQVHFGAKTKRKPLYIAFTNDWDMIGNETPLPVTEGEVSITVVIEVSFVASENKIKYRVHDKTMQACGKILGPLTSDHFPFGISITRGLLPGDTVEIIKETRNGVLVVIKKCKENPIQKALPPSDEQKRGKQKTSDVSNRGADQGKDGHDNQNAPSSDVSKSGPSMIAAIVVVIVAFLMN